MLWAISSQTGEAKRVDSTSLGEQGFLERRDLETWVADHPEILGEDLLVLTTEYDRFDDTKERLDVLAIDKRGKLVIVELKRDSSGTDAALQALKYAAFCSTMRLSDAVSLLKEQGKQRGRMDEDSARQAIQDFVGPQDFHELDDKPRVILVACEFRKEVTSTVLWLRTFGVDISCVKLTPYLLPSGEFVVDASVIIPLPETAAFMMDHDRKAQGEARTPMADKQLGFWTHVLGAFAERLPNVKVPRPRAASFIQFTAGYPSFHFEWYLITGQVSVCLDLEATKESLNQRVADHIMGSREALERELSACLDVEVRGRGRHRRICAKRDGDWSVDDAKAWATELMVGFWTHVKPILDDAMPARGRRSKTGGESSAPPAAPPAGPKAPA